MPLRGPALGSLTPLPEGYPSALLSIFRMNTSKSVSKQRLLSPFRMNTYAKPPGGSASLMGRYISDAQASYAEAKRSYSAKLTKAASGGRPD
jgi:hypothetical protein